MVDDDPPRPGFDEQVDPAVEHLTIVLDELHGMLNQDAVRTEPGVKDRPEASCTFDCVRRGHRLLADRILDDGRGVFDCVVSAWIYELRGNHCMERGADPPHVIAVNRKAWP